MQTLPQRDTKHLSHDAALMLLAVLPDHIRTAYLNHAKQIDYSVELVLEMALADFLDPESSNLHRLPTSDRLTRLRASGMKYARQWLAIVLLFPQPI